MVGLTGAKKELPLQRRLFSPVIGICLIVSSFSVLLCDKTSFFYPHKITLYLTMWNDSNETFDFSVFIYTDKGLFDFSNAKVDYISGEFYVDTIKDGSGLELYAKEFHAEKSLKLKVENVSVTPQFSLGMSSVELNFQNATNFQLSDISYNAVFSVYNLHGISIASKHIFTVRLNQYNQIPYCDYRNNLVNYLNILCIETILIGIFLVLIYFRKEISVYFPYLSAFLVWTTIFIYIFVGSGYEINETNSKIPCLFVSFLVHGDNAHINSNLVYFSIVSILLELFIKMKRKKLKMDLVFWFLVPLLLPLLVSLGSFIRCGQFGFGLSYSIESMTWFLWAYIIVNFKEVIKNRLRVFMAIFSGIPSYVFVEWLIGFLFGYYSKNYYHQNQALEHIIYGIISALVTMALLKSFHRFSNRQYY
jgi:hypothetical protein